VIPDIDLAENGLLIVTGSNLRAERADRPLAYQLQRAIGRHGEKNHCPCSVVVLSDLWYLHAEPLQKLPLISIGGPNVNAVSANLYKQLQNTLVVESALVIQMDPALSDLRAAIWGANSPLTINALDIFIGNGYLERFLRAVLGRFAK